ncbi:MAG: acetyl-CoA carboxylase, biotin carboxyl carrier protein [Alphaproteobacteria bacterium]|nr:acetyl-CoA carboxylase, biotin carboxyl carrier protein [Alphaproteobacteria bacterium]
MKKKELLDLIKSLADVIEDCSINEIELEEGGQKIRLVRGGGPTHQAVVHTTTPTSYEPPVTTVPISPTKPQEEENKQNLVLSPMVGVAYLASDPDAAPFAFEGKSVKEGDTLLIIEAMKVMNPIKAHKSGVVKKILAKNEIPVEFGETLVVIE